MRYLSCVLLLLLGVRDVVHQREPPTMAAHVTLAKSSAGNVLKVCVNGAFVEQETCAMACSPTNGCVVVNLGPAPAPVKFQPRANRTAQAISKKFATRSMARPATDNREYAPAPAARRRSAIATLVAIITRPKAAKSSTRRSTLAYRFQIPARLWQWSPLMVVP